MEQKPIVHIIGAGLAGSEAAWQLAGRGVKVLIHEMRPQKKSPAHQTGKAAELVCSNSLRSDDAKTSAIGVLHQEMRLFGSLVLEAADACRVPAGGALAVDRDRFSCYIDNKLRTHPLIDFVQEEVKSLPETSTPVIVASGPLTSEPLSKVLEKEIGQESLSFFDAIAPIVYKDSINFDKAWYQSRYDKGDKFDYINCPLSKEEYEAFLEALKTAEKTEFHAFETPSYFDGCLPVEVMAERGENTLVFGPMKPVGLTNPHAPDKKPYAVVQLRQDNQEDTLRNMVGFQTKMKHAEQTRVFRMIPGLENARFARLGGIHKNTFIKSPIVLDDFLRLKTAPHISFAGQITGCEGYVESAAVGAMVGYFKANELLSKEVVLPPRSTAFGSLYAHLRDKTNIENYQPMNMTFGLFPPLERKQTASGKYYKLKGLERKQEYADRALKDIKLWLENIKA